MCWVCHTVKAQQKHPCTSAASLIGSYFQIIVRVCYAAFLMQSYVIYLKRGIPLPVFCVFLCNMGY